MYGKTIKEKHTSKRQAIIRMKIRNNTDAEII